MEERRKACSICGACVERYAYLDLCAACYRKCAIEAYEVIVEHGSGYALECFIAAVRSETPELDAEQECGAEAEIRAIMEAEDTERAWGTWYQDLWSYIYENGVHV